MDSEGDVPYQAKSPLLDPLPLRMTQHCIQMAQMQYLAVMAPPAICYLEWAGMEINIRNCGITAMDMTASSNRQRHAPRRALPSHPPPKNCISTAACGN